ncbi:hypothetical protein [Acinetobacter calcoaceticus]|uniref:hypothetical protein n=1 Tax=Acinetobacter calcoaceticus TaxID=471 RepID=UPI00124E6E2C|nr:hypothetical protein [Acinetobacter calcoaceticus]
MLELINIFEPPFEIWSKREPTAEDFKSGKFTMFELTGGIKVKIEKTINNPYDAVQFILEENGNAFFNFVEDKLNKSDIFKNWLSYMPPLIPSNILQYQEDYKECNLSEVSREINESGVFLSEGQILFHGGRIHSDNNSLINLVRPLSTTLCPRVALSEALHREKAYRDDEINIYALKVKSPKTKVYIYQHEDSKLGHEKEVLFTGGASLEIVNKYLIKDSHPIYDVNFSVKNVPVYLIEATIS